VIIKIKVG